MFRLLCIPLRTQNANRTGLFHNTQSNTFSSFLVNNSKQASISLPPEHTRTYAFPIALPPEHTRKCDTRTHTHTQWMPRNDAYLIASPEHKHAMVAEKPCLPSPWLELAAPVLSSCETTSSLSLLVGSCSRGFFFFLQK